MHAWAALKPAEIVQAARALRDMVTGAKPDDEASDARSGEAPPTDTETVGGAAPAE